MIAFEENIKFQKKYFPDIYDSYESAGNEEAKAKVRSRLEILAPKYIYIYFGAKENKAMQKVLEDIFFLKNVDGSSFMIMRGWMMKLIIRMALPDYFIHMSAKALIIIFH